MKILFRLARVLAALARDQERADITRTAPS
jgi:hypothetical protein